MANKKPVDWFIKANTYRTHASRSTLTNLKTFNLKLQLIRIENENQNKINKFRLED